MTIEFILALFAVLFGILFVWFIIGIEPTIKEMRKKKMIK